jgi:hypothetical protein
MGLLLLWEAMHSDTKHTPTLAGYPPRRRAHQPFQS